MTVLYDFRLKVFQCVAWNLSFTKAARELNISQPAITRHIKELEAAYETKLFERTGNRISLTAAGRTLLGECDSLLEGYERMNYKMNLLNDKRVGHIRIGASLTIAQYILPELLACFCKEYPDISTELIMHNTVEIEEMLQAQKINIALVEGVSRKPELKYTPFLKDEIVAVARPGTVTEEGTLAIDRIKGYNLILREHTSGTTQFVLEALKRAGIDYSDLRVKMQMGSTEGIKSFVKHSDTIGLLSVYSVGRELLDGELEIVEFADFSIDRDFCLLQSQGDTSEINRLFHNFIVRKSAEKYGVNAYGTKQSANPK